jgi:ABC-type transport system involved in multi-copper enzyme maturation permease subunit
MIHLFYKAWLETRTRFIVGLIALCGFSIFLVGHYPPDVQRLAAWALTHPAPHRPWWFDREIHNYMFYIWHRQYGGLIRDAWMVIAVLFAVGGLTQESAKGSVAFSLSLPVKRNRFTIAYSVVACAELLVCALSPAVIIPAISSFVGESYSVNEALSRSLILFLGGVVLFGFTLFVASLVTSPSVPVIVGIASVIVLGTILSPYDDPRNEPSLFRAIDLFRLMSGPPDLRWHTVPWIGLLSCAGLFVLSFFAASALINSRDYR